MIAYPEQFFSSYAMPDIISYEALLVPIFIGGNEPLGALWVISHDKDRRFDKGDASILTELASFAGIALKMIRDTRALKQALVVQETLTREMRHRISNILTVAGGLVTASARTAKTPEELAVSVRGRLEALGRAQSIIHKAHGGEIKADSPAAAAFACQLRALVNVIAAPYGEDEGRLILQEPADLEAAEIPIGQGGLTALGLILHELATNAAKYGALSSAVGHVNINWHIEGDTCILVWQEHEGPPIEAPPLTLGFGSNLIRRTVAGQLGGNVSFEWLSEGLCTTIRISRKALAR